MHVNDLGSIPQGLTDPVNVYEVVGVTTCRGRLQATAGRGLTRFVGRQHEIETLHRALAQAASGGAQIVAVVGEAGVGKSHLACAF